MNAKINNTSWIACNPRFSTEEFEKSVTRNGCRFEITDMFFDDEKPSYPTWVSGYVIPDRKKKIQASWNWHGESWCDGRHCPEFDLVRPVKEEIETAKVIVESCALGALVILISILF